MPLSEKINKTQENRTHKSTDAEYSGYHPGKHPHLDFIITNSDYIRMY